MTIGNKILAIIFATVAFVAEAATETSTLTDDNNHTVNALSDDVATLHGRKTVGLVLSGGGARGIAEIGAIKAFEENGIPIDCVAGTSMGAIVGSLYASGYSPDEMMELITSKMFLNASTGTIDTKDDYLFFTPKQSPALLNLRFSSDKLQESKLLPSSLISPMPMNFQFMRIYAGYTAQCGGDFNKLFVPLRTVASDMTNHRKVVFKNGPLDDAVRSSMSFPIVFKPVTIDGALYYDGGIYDNFPVEVMKSDFHPDFVIGVDIHSTDTIKGFPDILQQMDLLVIRPTNNYEVPAEDGVKLRIDVNKYGLLDFPKADKIYEAGYRGALEMVDSIKSRLTSSRSPEVVAARRDQFKRHAKPVVFEGVNVTGGTQSQNEFIRYMFTPEGTDIFSLDQAMEAYTKVLSTGMLKDLEPTAIYNPETGRFRLNLVAEIKDNIDLGIGGYVTSTVNSMLYLSVGYRSFDFRSIDASVSGWLGQSYMAGELNARAILRRRQTSSLGFQATVWRQKYYESDKLFYEDDSPAFITHLEAFTRLKYSIATGRRAMIDFGIAYGYLNDKFYNNDASILESSTERNRSHRHLGQLMVRWENNTLDNNLLPTSGRRIAAMAQGIISHYAFTPGAVKARSLMGEMKGSQSWGQVEFNIRDYYPIGDHLSLGYESTLLASTRKHVDNYNAAIVEAYSFQPTPSSYSLFNSRFRANSFVTLSAVPVYKFNDRFEMRASLNGFLPIRPIVATADGGAKYGDWFSKASFLGELSATLKLPFANLSVYGTYQTCPGDKWGVGISFGYFILAPKLLRL